MSFLYRRVRTYKNIASYAFGTYSNISKHLCEVSFVNISSRSTKLGISSNQLTVRNNDAILNMVKKLLLCGGIWNQREENGEGEVNTHAQLYQWAKGFTHSIIGFVCQHLEDLTTHQSTKVYENDSNLVYSFILAQEISNAETLAYDDAIFSCQISDLLSLLSIYHGRTYLNHKPNWNALLNIDKWCTQNNTITGSYVDSLPHSFTFFTMKDTLNVRVRDAIKYSR